MKKVLTLLFLLTMFFAGKQAVGAMTYEEAMSQTKPFVLLVYAPWADNVDTVMQSFNNMQQKYSSTYNFVAMNIATKDSNIFNIKYHIYPNLPYILLYKDKGKISRYLQQNCILDDSCFAEKLDFFSN